MAGRLIIPSKKTQIADKDSHLRKALKSPLTFADPSMEKCMVYFDKTRGKTVIGVEINTPKEFRELKEPYASGVRFRPTIN